MTLSITSTSNSTGRRQTGFTLVELLVVIGIIAVLISMLMPSLKKARQAALNVQCLSNLRSTSMLLSMYMTQHTGGKLIAAHQYTNPDTFGGLLWTNRLYDARLI